MKKRLLTMVVAGLCGAVAAETYYLKSTDNMGDSAMTNAANWGVGSASGAASGAVGAPLDPDGDYVINASKQLRSPDMAEFTFPGKSFTLDHDDAVFAFCARKSGSVYTFDDLVANRGTICNWWGNNPVLAGKVTFHGTSSSPIQLYDNGNGSAITFTAEVHGDADSHLLIYNSWSERASNTWSQKHCRIIFAGDSLADFHGHIVCRQYKGPAGKQPDPEYRASLVTGGVSNDCSVVADFRAGLAANETKTVSIKSLTLADGAFLTVKYDKSTRTASRFDVRESLTMTGRTSVEFDPGTITIGNYPDEDVVPECAILTAPAGVTLDAANFTLATTVVFPVYELSVRNDDAGRSTLYLRQCGKVVKSTATDTTTLRWEESKNCTGAHWSDGEPPSGDKLYYCTHELRAYATNNTYNTYSTFAGRTLAMNGSQMDMFAKYYTIEDLRVLTRYAIYNYNGVASPTWLYGNIYVAGGDKGLSLKGNDGRTLNICSTISGPGNVYIDYVNSVGGNHVNVYGTNVNHTGRFYFSSSNDSNSDEKFVTMEFDNPHAMGGDIASWSYNSHEFGYWAHLKPTTSMTLACRSRGIFMSGECTIETAEGITFGITERITWKGTMRKNGSGTFALGGEAPYFNSNGGTTPTADKNRLMIDEGALKPLSAEAFDGVAVTLADGASITLAVPEKDGVDGLAAYGMKLVKAGSALNLPTDGVTVNFIDPAGAAKPAATLSRRVPVCTVASAAAVALRGKFAFGASPYGGYVLVPVEIDNGDGTVTFAADLVRGTAVIFR